MATEHPNSITINVLITRDGDLYVGHCLELDIVTADTNADQVKKDITDLIIAQIDYAFSNDNLENLYRPAPHQVWEEFYRCQALSEDRILVESKYQDDRPVKQFVPPWIIAKTCLSDSIPHV